MEITTISGLHYVAFGGIMFAMTKGDFTFIVLTLCVIALVIFPFYMINGSK